MSVLIEQHPGETIDEASYRLAGELLREHLPGEHEQKKHGRKGSGGAIRSQGLFGGGVTVRRTKVDRHREANAARLKTHLKSKIIASNEGASPEAKQQLIDVMGAVADRMSSRSSMRVGNAIDSVVMFNSPEELTKVLANKFPAAKRLLDEGKTLGGSYMAGGRSIFMGVTRGKHVRGIAAHEMMHAVDGETNNISNSPIWQNAWKSEASKLSKYAMTSPSEGLAEFGRAMWGSDIPQEDIKRQFPRMYSAAERKGLL